MNSNARKASLVLANARIMANSVMAHMREVAYTPIPYKTKREETAFKSQKDYENLSAAQDKRLAKQEKRKKIWTAQNK